MTLCFTSPIQLFPLSVVTSTSLLTLSLGWAVFSRTLAVCLVSSVLLPLIVLLQTCFSCPQVRFFSFQILLFWLSRFSVAFFVICSLQLFPIFQGCEVSREGRELTLLSWARAGDPWEGGPLIWFFLCSLDVPLPQPRLRLFPQGSSKTEKLLEGVDLFIFIFLTL